MTPSENKVEIPRDPTDISPKVAVFALISAIGIVIQAVASGEFNSPELYQTVAWIVAVVLAYIKKDTVITF